MVCVYEADYIEIVLPKVNTKYWKAEKIGRREKIDESD